MDCRSQSVVRSLPWLVGRRILIVDDDDRVRRALGQSLERHGAQIALAASGETGVRMALRPPVPHLVVMDLTMPGIDGVTAVRQLRRAALRCPVLFVTGQPERIDAATLDELMPVRKLAKPSSLEQVLVALHALLTH